MRADNRGEGGILALASLVQRAMASRRRRTVLVLAMFGAALFYGDGVITPAISVLSAVEGLKVATPLFEPYVVPFALVILIALFVMQSRGTGKIGPLFGPVVFSGSSSLALLGLIQIVQTAAHSAGARPELRFRPVRRRTRVGVRDARRRFPRGDRRRGALRGHGSLWAAADPDRLVRAGSARAAAQLLRPRRVAARRSGHGGQSVLPAGPGVGAVPDGRARDLGHRDRVTGGHLGRLFAQRAGGPARLPAAAQRAPHLGADHGQIYIPAINWCCSPACSCSSSAFSPRAISPPLTASRSAAPWRSPPCSPDWSRAAAGGGRRRSWSRCSAHSSRLTSPSFPPTRSRSLPVAGSRSSWRARCSR